MTRVTRPLATLLALGLIGCDEDKASRVTPPATVRASATPPPVLAPADEAKQLAQTRCAMCHGAAGKGDGPTAATLNPKPRDLASKEWQEATSDGQIRTIILQGGVGVGKSPLMPPNPDLAQKPAVVEELVKIVRSYGS